ncbi:SpoIIE family protein phosphatase [Deltaproteobacteria bacterium TL4]
MAQYSMVILVSVVSVIYMGLLFVMAYYADKRSDEGRSIISNPYIYSLSMAVYCTSWTYYGSVGRAASTGVGFLPIYIGPTLMAILWVVILRKIIRISKVNRITSIADFISARYGKSVFLGGLVAVIAVIGIMPYISLQLKAVATSFNIIIQYPEVSLPYQAENSSIYTDTALYVTLFMALFTILFGTRHLDASEHHEGMVAAIAFESIVKLVAFLAVGIFVTYGLNNGFEDLFTKAQALPKLKNLFSFSDDSGEYVSWTTMNLLAMMSIMFLPRQFQVGVLENVNEKHLWKAVWLFPLYLLIINIFVLPIAFGGLIRFSGETMDPDTFVLTLPMVEHQKALALFAFIGGLSAATGMVIVETIALSTMVCNALVMPLLMKMRFLHMDLRQDLSGLLLAIRRITILLILLLCYLYFRIIGNSYALVTIGLVSFAAATQFAPAILGGIYWKEGTRLGAIVGLTGGFFVWAYTLLIPSFAKSGWLPLSFIEEGPLGMALLKPYQLFGLQGMDSLTHSLFWSMVANIGGYALISLWLKHQNMVEYSQALIFVDVFEKTEENPEITLWRGTASLLDLRSLLNRILGTIRAEEILTDYASQHHLDLSTVSKVDAELIDYAEKELSSVLGSASARIIIASITRGEELGMKEVMKVLDEASQAITQSRQAEEKALDTIKKQNEKLRQLDKLKDEFLANTSHELRTPLNAIIGLGESLVDGIGGPLSQVHTKNLQLIIQSGKRLAYLVNDILDFSKLKNHELQLQLKAVDIHSIVEIVLALSIPLLQQKSLQIHNEIPQDLPLALADENRLQQILMNLISNAVKFTHEGRITLSAKQEQAMILISVSDTGIGIREDQHKRIFQSFEQSDGSTARAYGGTGLGLAVTKNLVELHGGRITVTSKEGQGSTFTFTLPISRESTRTHSEQKAVAKVQYLEADSLSFPEIEITLTRETPLNRDSQKKPETFDVAQGKVYTILIVDDEPVNVQVLQNQLSLKHYECLVAYDGFQALNILQHKNPDLILLDLMMPRMSGYEVCQKIRESHSPAALPVILLTAKNQLTDLLQGLESGANDYLSKPFNKDELLARIKSQLQIKEAINSIKETQRLEIELKTAHTVQELLLPQKDPDLEEIELASFYHSASETGGDWFTYRYYPETQFLDVMIGDVTGHGIPAALITAVVESFFRSIEEYRIDAHKTSQIDSKLLNPAYLMERLNNVIYSITAGVYNMTFFYSAIDFQQQRLSYSCAAHNPCHVWRASKFSFMSGETTQKRSIIDLMAQSHRLGDQPGMNYSLQTQDLQSGDVLVWYTDGLVENTNAQGEMWDVRNLQRVIKTALGLTAQQIKDKIVEIAFQHYGEHPLEDDVTLIVGRIR